jgi:hypothetical protein
LRSLTDSMASNDTDVTPNACAHTTTGQVAACNVLIQPDVQLHCLHDSMWN